MTNSKKASNHPPKITKGARHIKVFLNNKIIADTNLPILINESGKKGVYYIPYENVRTEYLVKSEKTYECPWKGKAKYFDAEVDGKNVKDIAWTYRYPRTEYLSLKEYIAIEPEKADAYYINGELYSDPGLN